MASETLECALDMVAEAIANDAQTLLYVRAADRATTGKEFYDARDIYTAYIRAFMVEQLKDHMKETP